MGLLRQDTRRPIALKACVLDERGVAREGKLLCASGLLSVPWAGDSRSALDHCADLCSAYQKVPVHVGLLSAAVPTPLL